MRVVIVEDDYAQAELLYSSLREAWPQIEIERIETELEFRLRLPVISDHPPDVVIMDVMLRWCDPSSDMKRPPDEVLTDGYYRAGLRCINHLRQNMTTSHVPVILYSALPLSYIEENLGSLPNLIFLEKESDQDPLIRLVGSLLAAQKSTKEVSGNVRDVFICHASDDKTTVVEPLIGALEEAGITVWHDRAEIKWGDSLVSKIEEGLRISRYVLAVLSKHSVTKPWPRRELHAAMSREASTGEVKVLPLVVGSVDERASILLECALQNDKLYEVWTGSPVPIVHRLKQRLR